ncbi:GAF and ANTAR domain-containing protein [Couchioplanes azureus]|uniref:GAF and ANTAR domain-containing protein n=1 Tax=Couchioplanes caeruleus TaxID=56438 RepID=UPI00167032D9|nr:GAF and ANTAR domain-containing protein [Couchioplanes caeruleus]
MDLIEAFAETGRIRLAETDLDGMLDRIAHLAKRTIPGAAEVSITLHRGRGSHTAAFTGDVALALDQRQYEQGHGPCFQALASGETLSLPDMSIERRWPDFAARARDAGFHSSLSIGLPVPESAAGALNVYAITPHAFDDDAVTLGQTFAGYAAVVLANAHLHEARFHLAKQIQAAMASRAVVEQAKGIVMRDRHCSSEDAFKILTGLSQDTDRKLRDVAQALVDRATETSGPADGG